MCKILFRCLKKTWLRVISQLFHTTQLFHTAYNLFIQILIKHLQKQAFFLKCEAFVLHIPLFYFFKELFLDFLNTDENISINIDEIEWISYQNRFTLCWILG